LSGICHKGDRCSFAHLFPQGEEDDTDEEGSYSREQSRMKQEANETEKREAKQKERELDRYVRGREEEEV
jgi:hypothetical protein